jgi:vacuolar-type H+-ATPase subunit I/STV1
MFGLVLMSLSAVVYYIHYLIFRDVHHIFLYLIGDIAFVFIEVLLVTLVIHQLLHHREKKAMLNKLNMVIGAFFSEVGTELLKTFSTFDKDSYKITQKLVINNDWSDKEFLKVLNSVKAHHYDIDSKRGNLESLRDFLKERRQFLLGLLENPNLLEHESFTNLLWAVFHLTEELTQRTRLRDLPDSDYKHLAGDISRVYNLLIMEWLQYMEHLKNKYPYLFSLAMRTNPFDAAASVEIK